MQSGSHVNRSMPELALFAQILEKLMDQSGLNQTGLAKATGIPQTTLSRWLKDTEPNLSGLRTLAQFFDCSVDYLCGISSPPSELRAGNWIVDIDALNQIKNGRLLEEGESWAHAIPPRFRIVPSHEYQRISRSLSNKKA